MPVSGGDECFGGYRRYALMAAVDRAPFPLPALRSLRSLGTALARGSAPRSRRRTLGRAVELLGYPPAVQYARLMSYFTAEQKAASPYTPEGADPTIVTTPDVQATSGPQWLTNTPPLTISGDTLQVNSRALISPTGNSLARFDGAHYCTFVAPEYLRDVLLGERAVV